MGRAVANKNDSYRGIPYLHEYEMTPIARQPLHLGPNVKEK